MSFSSNLQNIFFKSPSKDFVKFCSNSGRINSSNYFCLKLKDQIVDEIQKFVVLIVVIFCHKTPKYLKKNNQIIGIYLNIVFVQRLLGKFYSMTYNCMAQKSACLYMSRCIKICTLPITPSCWAPLYYYI